MDDTKPSTKRSQALTHNRILEVGEAIKDEYERIFEQDKTKALMATEELVRREEQFICEEKLHQAKNKWLKEKQKILQERQKHEVLAIAEEKKLLTEQLLLEFEAAKREIDDQNQKTIQEKVEETWKKAETIRQQSVENARDEERSIAEEIASATLEQVEEDMEQEKIQYQQQRRQALLEQKERLIAQCSKEKDQLEKKLEQQHKTIVEAILTDHESEITTSQQVYYELLLVNNNIKEQLRLMMDDRDYWKDKYEELKEEFSDFIDQFPGFKGDFLLK